MMDERLCECGCGRPLAGRSGKARFYEDRCRARMYHERQRAAGGNPGPKAHNPGLQAGNAPKAKERTEKYGRPAPHDEQRKPPVRPHGAGDRRSEGDRGPYVAGEPIAIDKETWERIKKETAEARGLAREVKDSEITDADVTVYHNNLISNALAEQASTCRGCGRRGGGNPAKGGAGPLRTKMGRPGAWCGDCWRREFPGEA